MSSEEVAQKPAVPMRLVRIVINGNMAFYGAILQHLGGHPYLVLRSGHILLFDISLQRLLEFQKDQPVLYGPSKIDVMADRDPEPVAVLHRGAHAPSKHVVSSNESVGAFIHLVFGKAVMTGKGKWVMCDIAKAPNTPEGIERLLDQEGQSAESVRDGLNQVLDILLPAFP